MAIYHGSAVVSQVIGHLGGFDFMRWKNKNVVRIHPPIVSDPKSLKQIAMRAAVSQCGARWRTVLTPDQRTAWEAYAQTYRMRMDAPSGIRQIPQGNTGNFHGLNAYILVNTKRASAFMPILDAAPLGRPRDETIHAFGAFWTPGVGPINVSWLMPPTAAPGDYVRVWIDSIQELFHRQIAMVFAVETLLGVIPVVTGAGGAPIPLVTLVPSDVIVQADLLYDDGRIAASTECIDVQLI